jgi:hypothetical protein
VRLLAASVKSVAFVAFINQRKKAWGSQLSSTHEFEMIQSRFDKRGCASVMVEGRTTGDMSLPLVLSVP